MPRPNILFISAGLFHPSLAARWALFRALSAKGEYRFRSAYGIEALADLPAGSVHAAVLFIHEQKLPPGGLEGLEAFLRAGGGVLAVHSATASYKTDPRFGALLGGRFTGHGPVEPFTANPVEGAAAGGGENPFDGLPPFTVRDELYRHALEEGIHPHYYAMLEGEEIPVVWTYRVGAGRVCYACPGHTAAALRNATVQEVLRRGLRWVRSPEAGR